MKASGGQAHPRKVQEILQRLIQQQGGDDPDTL